MKRSLRTSTSVAFLVLLNLICYSQTDRFAYAVTDITQEGVNWSFLRKIDLKNGAFSEVMLNGTDASTLPYDEASKKQMTEPFTDARFGKMANAPFATGVAAIAYDKKNQRIYYTPMFINQFRYIDLKSMKVYFVTTPGIDALGEKASDQSNIITRMTIGADGNVYALTNDANHLLRFTTGKKIALTDLGAITDHPSNNQVSVHNSCTSFGGDMIADDDGNLYLFSNRTNVFKINIDTKVATHLGVVSGLPATYSINGAAVDDNNQVLVTSAADHTKMFTVDSKSWSATAATSTGGWRTADLANSNLLQVRKPLPFVRLLETREDVDDGRIQVYPNPVTNDQFTVQFNTAGGKYRIEVKDALGRQVTQSQASIGGKGQTSTLKLPAASTKGFYLVKIVDEDNKTIYSKKILVLEN
jgi:hypothetical protein